MRPDPDALPVLGAMRAHHVAIHTPDLSRLRAFYVETLGLPVVGRFAEHGILFVDAGGTLLELIEEPGLPAGGAEGAPRRGWSHLAWEVEDVDAAYAALAGRGVPLRSPPEDFPPEAPTLRIAFVADPDGNLLELLRPLPGPSTPTG